MCHARMLPRAASAAAASQAPPAPAPSLAARARRPRDLSSAAPAAAALQRRSARAGVVLAAAAARGRGEAAGGAPAGKGGREGGGKRAAERHGGGRERGERGERGARGQPHGRAPDAEYYKSLVHELSAGADDDDDFDAPFFDAVVKVYCSHSEPDFSLPWQRQRQYSSTSSGFIIDGRRVLTNAHSVDYHTQVMVQRRGDDQRYVATVLAIGPECDIALLSVEDDAFFGDVEPLRLGPLPRLQDEISVVGYPVGGDTISVTQGVVSRIEVTNYVHGSGVLLGIQIDAAINSGNSGGPAFNEAGECVGIAFQSLTGEDAENIGYVIPTPVVAHFLADYAMHGAFTGFPCVDFLWQTLESPALRSSLGMSSHQKGVLIVRVLPTAPAAGALRAGDVLMRFDGVPISSDGTVPFRTGERIAFSHLIAQKFVGDRARLRLLRGGAEVDVDVPLGVPTTLVPHHLPAGGEPPYLIVAGLVFTACSEPYLTSEFGDDLDMDCPVPLLDRMLHGVAEVAGEQVVLLSQVLADNVNVGYQELENVQVKAFNGEPVRSLAQLARAVDGCGEQYLRFELQSGAAIVLGAAAARRATPHILATHSIPAAASRDLLPLLSAAPAAAAGNGARGG